MNLDKDQEKRISGLLASIKSSDDAQPSTSRSSSFYIGGSSSESFQQSAEQWLPSSDPVDYSNERSQCLYDYKDDSESSFMYEYHRNKLANKSQSKLKSSSGEFGKVGNVVISYSLAMLSNLSTACLMTPNICLKCFKNIRTDNFKIFSFHPSNMCFQMKCIFTPNWNDKKVLTRSRLPSSMPNLEELLTNGF